MNTAPSEKSEPITPGELVKQPGVHTSLDQFRRELRRNPHLRALLSLKGGRWLISPANVPAILDVLNNGKTAPSA